MKKYILLFLLLIPFSVSAKSSLELSGPSQVALWEEFQIQATLQSEDSGIDITGVDIGGKENFTIWASSSQSKILIINGKTQSQLEFSFNMTPTKEGNFTLWPIKIRTGKWELTSNTLSINVGKSTSKPSSPTLHQNTSSDDLPNDIYDVQKPSFPFTWVGIFLLFTLAVGAFYYFLSRYFFAPEKQNLEKKQETQTVDISLEEKYIQTLEWIDTTQIKNAFYKQFNDTLRQYFEEKWLADASKLTYEELRWHPFFMRNFSFFSTIFARSYREEFTETPDELPDRQSLLKQTIDILRS